MSKKWLLSISVVMLIFIMAACSDNDSADGENSNTNDANNGEVGEQTEAPKPDLENIPDVVAEVNGEEISKEEFESVYQTQFQQVMMQAQFTGQEVDQDQLKGQIIDALIGQKLVLQEADNRGLEASEEAVNETIDSLVTQNGFETQDELFDAFKVQAGMEKEEVLAEIEMQVKVEKLIASESGDAEPTKEELQEVYDTYVAQLEQVSKEDEEVEIPSFEEMEADLINHVKSQKESETYQKLVEKLQEDADITKNL
ncbi:SurA N-terminal domain-containing protein [Ornithinibacillus halotolerans]|uniref:peptidylprolyl isomerase n=1 Tax=Ornithinibacillus halotolerans TaxID=1274357 RepID=A0A916RQM6_9BACI|nr:SurA N-terminal domain-containing protein [Ornithinibacillus halotolerans]GGA66533.1 hypothetical protein GCM10008025_07970 [Ornithinibacillus halotolerans]